MTTQVRRKIAQPFVWDLEAEVLRFNGAGDPDPDWTWVPEKWGYEPVNTYEKVWDARVGMWIFLQVDA